MDCCTTEFTNELPDVADETLNARQISEINELNEKRKQFVEENERNYDFIIDTNKMKSNPGLRYIAKVIILN